MDPTCSPSAAPGALTVQVCFPAARAAVLDNLNRQREEGRLCDLSIQVQGEVFRAHRCVLAASSPYFHDQVLLKNVTTVSLPSVMDPVAFESVLSSAYTGQLSIVHDDIVNYVTVASFLQMWHIVDKCTEILKRPRPPADVVPAEAPAAHAGTTSRQQSPSSTDCLYVEREGKRKDRKPDTLPPLATWRRPQQFPRWGRPRPPSAQHSADSQLDALPGYVDSNYSSCEETWVTGHAKTSHSSHDGSAHGSRPPGGFPTAEALRQRARVQQRGAPPSANQLDKSRDSGGSEETPEKRKDEKRELEADEGVGEHGLEKKEGFPPVGYCVLDDDVRQAPGKTSAGDTREKVADNVSSDLLDVCQKAEGAAIGPCPVSTRGQWHTGPWTQQEGEGGVCRKDEEEEEDVDFDCFTGGTFSKETYDEIQDGTGQVSQRPLVPASPDVTMATSEGTWPSTSVAPATSRHLSPCSASLQPPSSPPTPSSSSVTLAGAPYMGKVHFCHCGKAYTLKSMRDRHVKMQHLNLRPFGCPVCTKSFKMKHHLTKHLKTHGGLRPYECSLCGKKVIWRDSFLRHQARCERLASSSSANSSNTSSAAADVDNSYAYGFDDGEAFLAMGGHVKVEEVDLHGEMGDGMDGLLGSVSGMVDELRTPAVNGGQGYKEEERESFRD